MVSMSRGDRTRIARSTAALGLCVGVVACAPRTAAERQAELERTRGTISGVVVSARSGAPLPGVMVTAEGEYLAAQTSRDGTFRIPDLDPGSIIVATSRRDLVTTRTEVPVTAGRATSVTLRVTKAPPAFGQLKGTWRLELGVETMEDQDEGDVSDLPQRVGARVHFEESAADHPAAANPIQVATSARAETLDEEDATMDESGEVIMDVPTPRASHDIARVFSKEFLTATAANGYVYDTDKVSIHLGANETGGEGFQLEGRLKDGAIQGRWRWSWPGCFPGRRGAGTFVMARTAPVQ